MTQVEPGWIGFAHNRGVMGRLIRLGEWLRFRKGSRWNHQFVVDRVEDGVPYIIQAVIRGVTDTAKLADVAPGGKYIMFPPPSEVDVDRLLAFARAQAVGLCYGIGTIIAHRYRHRDVELGAVLSRCQEAVMDLLRADV